MRDSNVFNQQLDIAVFILPGAKKQGKCYKDIKEMIYRNRPCPCQVVLSSTLKSPKNLRSIINKILIQMNVKMGGVPWAIGTMPFIDRPTSVMGYNMTKLSGDNHVSSLVATMNSEFTKYTTSAMKSSDALCTSLQQ